MADVEIDSLELKITGDAKDAQSSLDALITTLDTLKTKTNGGLGLTSVANQVGKLADAAGKLNGSEGSKLKSLADGLKALSNLGNLKISPTIANQISSIGGAVNTLNGVDYSKIGEVANAMTPLTTLGKSNLGSVLNSLKKIPEVISALDKVDMAGFSAKIQQLTTSLKPLADEMQKVSNGFAAFPEKIQRYISANSKVPNSNMASTLSFAKLAAKITITIHAFRRIGSVIARWINKSNQYIENLNLFNVSMGKYAASAQEYAEKVGDIMGIDPGQWMRYQGLFMTLATGFGISDDRAAKMSKQMTQLGYDMASYYNISFEEAMQKLQSGFAGELEPMRRLGYDLSKARLEQIALNLGITKSFEAMTQAEKAQLRYYAIMTQVVEVQGDMARTLDAPANQLRVLKAQLEQAARSLGNIFIPMLNAVLPYAIAAAKAIRILADAIARLFGFSLPKVDYSFSSASAGVGGISDELDDATGSAGKLKKMLLGIDELNVLPDASSGGGGYGVGGGGDLDFELPEYDFIGNAVSSKVNEIVDKMMEWLGINKEIDSWSDLFNTRLGKILETVMLIGVGFAAWKISKGLLNGIKLIEGLTSKKFTVSFGVVGAIAFIADLDRLKKFCEDFVDNGPTFSNVAGILSEFAGLVGDALIALGRVEIGGPLKVVQGIGEIASAIKDISDNGLDTESVTDVVRGITNIVIGVSVLTGKYDMAGIALSVQGINSIVRELSENWEKIRDGDWSGVDKATLAVGAIEAIGGILTALGILNKIKETVDCKKSIDAMSEVSTVTETISTTTSTITTKLGDLVKNLGLGIAIIAEVVVAAGLFVGGIWLLGFELERVGTAWEPVIENGDTIAIAMGLGTLILLGVGVATAVLGKLGKSVAADIGVGTLILAELGIATGLFIAEIWGIGKGLDEIGKAWKPVEDNGESIAEAIAIGTGLLIGIGVVAAGLGAATVASAGTLPVAIALGTALLVELTAAFIDFTDELIKVADHLSDALHPALIDLTKILPKLETNMSQFTTFMSGFAEKVVAFTKASVISGISNTIKKVVGFFTGNPIKNLSDEVDSQYDEMTKLRDNLDRIVPVIRDADRLMGEFNDEMAKLKASTGIEGKSPGTIGYIISVGVQLVKSGWSSIDGWLGDLSTTLKVKLPHVSVSWINTGFQNVRYPEFNVSYYAGGGFPSEGEMFVAREAGPEMVGSIGSRTAVANNDQIVESVSKGVYEAVMAANGHGGTTVQATVNDRVLFEVLVNRARQESARTGYNPLLGGV